jgi:hypothetical protein
MTSISAQIEQIDYAKAPPNVRAAHDHEIQARGHATNMKRTLMHSPLAYHAYMEWYTLRDALQRAVPDRAIWLFSHAISSGYDCLICTTFFRRALIDAGYSPEDFAPSEEEELLIAFGGAITKDSNRVPDALWRKIKARYDVETQVNLVAFAGIMIATNVFNNVVGVTLDPELEPYRAKR